WTLPAVGPLPDELLSVVDRDVEVELLVEFPLPLGQQRLGHEDEDSPGQLREPRLADEEARRDRLAETHLVGEEHLAGPRLDEPLVSPRLVGPGRDGRGYLTDPEPIPGSGGVVD